MVESTFETVEATAEAPPQVALSCRALMQHMQQQDRDDDAVRLHVVSGGLVVVAQSRRCLALQHHGRVENIPWNNGPCHSKSDFFDEEDEDKDEDDAEECMTSSTVLPMPAWMERRRKRWRRRARRLDDKDTTKEHAEEAEEGEAEDEQHPLAIIMVGTSHCRVFCIPVLLPHYDSNDENDDKLGSSVLAPWEPLPLSSTSLVRTPGDSGGGMSQGKLVVVVKDEGDEDSSVAAPPVDDVSTASVTSRKSICSSQHTLATASQANLSQQHRSNLHSNMVAAAAASGDAQNAAAAAVAFEPTGGVLQLTPFGLHFVWITYGDGTAVRLPQSLLRWTAHHHSGGFLSSSLDAGHPGEEDDDEEAALEETIVWTKLPLAPLSEKDSRPCFLPLPLHYPSLLMPPPPPPSMHRNHKLSRTDSEGWTEQEEASQGSYSHHYEAPGAEGVLSDEEGEGNEDEEEGDYWFYEDPFVTLSHRAYTHALVWSPTATATNTSAGSHDATLAFYTSEDWTTTAFVDAEHVRRLKLYHSSQHGQHSLGGLHESGHSDKSGGGMSRTSSSASLLAEIGYEVVKSSVGALLNMTSLMSGVGGYSSLSKATSTAAAPASSKIPLSHAASTANNNNNSNSGNAMPKAYWSNKRDEEEDDDDDEGRGGGGEEGSHGSLGSSEQHRRDTTAPITSLYTTSMNDPCQESTASTAPSVSNPPVIHMRPVRELNTLSHLWYDAPRKISFCSVDPTGTLAALSDALGRVSLMDLETKQVVRLFKGVRDATACGWIQQEAQYLVIYAPARQVVHVFRLLHGPRVASFSVSGPICLIPAMRRHKDDHESDDDDDDGKEQNDEEEAMASCYIFHKNTNMLELLTFTDPDVPQEGVDDPPVSSRQLVTPTAAASPPAPPPFRRRASFTKAKPAGAPATLSDETHSLRMLQQLLSVEGGEIRPDAEVLYAALAKITTLSNLVVALDELAVAENAQPLDGSTFHAIVIAYCQKMFDDVMTGTTLQVTQSCHLQSLSIRLDIHQQIMAAYDVLHNFELAEESDRGDEEEGDEDEVAVVDAKKKTMTTGDDEVVDPDAWSSEAVGWVSSWEVATGRLLDADVAVVSHGRRRAGNLLPFPHFARACLLDFKESRLERDTASGGAYRIYFCESTKERKLVLRHLFQPLLRDVFVLQFVNGVLDHLNIRHNADKLQQYFGEWFMTLSSSVLSRESLFMPWSPPVRWLQDLCTPLLEKEESGILLGTLHRYCRESQHLVRAFALACVCRQAVSAASSQAEAKTYGKVLQRTVVAPWEELLCQLRLCLLVSMRLYGARLGALPLTVARVDAGETFSPYEWLALDELSMTHNAEEVVALEQACRVSRFQWMEGGDWQVVQRAATLSQPKLDERGPLLLYLSDFVRPLYLSAHRALLLAGFWARQPDSLEVLKDCIAVLRTLHDVQDDRDDEDERSSLAAAVRLEVFQVHIRPIYRALLFGFDDVFEVSEDVVGPLCDDSSWLRQFHGCALAILGLIRETPCIVAPKEKEEEDVQGAEEEKGESGKRAWPRPQGDVVLSALVSRPRSVQVPSLEVHRAILYAAQVSDDPESWAAAVSVPSVEDLFLATSLFEEMVIESELTEEAMDFLEGALQRKAREQEEEASGSRLVVVELEDLENLGRLWGMAGSEIRSRFLLALYELDNDAAAATVAEELSVHLHVAVFLEGGLDIVSLRLQSIMASLRRVGRYRGILGMLDADTCVWVQERAVVAAGRRRRQQRQRRPKVEAANRLAGRANETHAFILRLLRMSLPETVDRVHGLSVLSGTLVNAMRHADFDATPKPTTANTEHAPKRM